jgi:hypothetical protein
MIKYLQIPVGKHGTINVEVESTEDSSGFQRLGRIQEIAQAATAEATEAFDKITDTIYVLAHGFRERLDRLEKTVRPDEVSVEFGLALKADAGVVIARAGTEASFKIKLGWKPSAPQQEK